MGKYFYIFSHDDDPLKKAKCTLVQALMLCTGRTVHRGSRGIALPFHDCGTRRGWGVSITPWLLFTPRKDRVPIVQETGWATGPVWTGAENLAPTGIRSLDRPVRSQSLYRLSYPAHWWPLRVKQIAITKTNVVVTIKNIFVDSTYLQCIWKLYSWI